MPILLVFLVVAACLPIEWPAPPFGLGPTGSSTLTAAAIILALVAAFLLRSWTLRTIARHPDRKSEAGQSYLQFRRLLFFVNVGIVATAIVGLGWGWTVQDMLALAEPEEGTPMERLAPFAEFAVPLPYFLIVFGSWLIYYDVEKALLRSTAPGQSQPHFWSRTGYFFHNLRQMGLLVLLPVGLFVAQQSLYRLFPETASSDWVRISSLAVLPVFIIVLPLLIKPLLGLQSMPRGPVRDRIESLAGRLGFRYTDLLIWPTCGASVNAMIVGLIPRVRYVIFTDRILEEMPPDEVDAVFGHEVGHAHHGHIWFYALFLALSMTVLAALLLLLAQQLGAAIDRNPNTWYAHLIKEQAGWMALPPVILAAAYVFLFFGFLSRRCERQADIFGCRAVSCANPECSGHDPTTPFPPHGTSLCPTGIRTFTRALERVGHLNGYSGPEDDLQSRRLRGLIADLLGWLRAWQHSTMPRRVNFLLSLIDEPARERRFQRRVFLLRWGLVLGLGTLLVVLGQAVGWRQLLQTL